MGHYSDSQMCYNFSDNHWKTQIHKSVKYSVQTYLSFMEWNTGGFPLTAALLVNVPKSTRPFSPRGLSHEECPVPQDWQAYINSSVVD